MNVRSSKDPGLPTNSANLLQKRVSPQCSTAQGPKNDGFKAQQLYGNSQGLAKKHTTSYYYDIPSIKCKFIYSFTFQDSLLCLYNIIIQLRAFNFTRFTLLSMGFSFRKFRKWGDSSDLSLLFRAINFCTIFLPRFGPWCIQLPTGPGNKIMSQVAAGHHSAGHLDTVPGRSTGCSNLMLPGCIWNMKTYESIYENHWNSKWWSQFTQFTSLPTVRHWACGMDGLVLRTNVNCASIINSSQGFRAN